MSAADVTRAYAEAKLEAVANAAADVEKIADDGGHFGQPSTRLNTALSKLHRLEAELIAAAVKWGVTRANPNADLDNEVDPDRPVCVRCRQNIVNERCACSRAA